MQAFFQYACSDILMYRNPDWKECGYQLDPVEQRDNLNNNKLK